MLLLQILNLPCPVLKAAHTDCTDGCNVLLDPWLHWLFGPLCANVNRRAMACFSTIANGGDSFSEEQLVNHLLDEVKARKVFKSIDINGDNKVSRLQFIAYVAYLERKNGKDGKWAALAELDQLETTNVDYSRDCEHTACELFHKGFSLDQLLGFVEEWCHKKEKSR